jgi:hypothetical protein
MLGKSATTVASKECPYSDKSTPDDTVIKENKPLRHKIRAIKKSKKNGQ